MTTTAKNIIKENADGIKSNIAKLDIVMKKNKNKVYCFEIILS